MSAVGPSTGRPDTERRTRSRGRFPRLGRGAQLTAIVLVAVFLAGLVLIADGLLLKAEGQQTGAGKVSIRFAEQSSGVGTGLPVRSR